MQVATHDHAAVNGNGNGKRKKDKKSSRHNGKEPLLAEDDGPLHHVQEREAKKSKEKKEGKKCKKENLKLKTKELVVVKESKIHGLGLFATRDIPNGTWVIQYIGPIVGPEEKRAMAPEDKRYLFKLQGDFSVDGSPLYNLARYINHKCSGNNCEILDKQAEGSQFKQIWIVSKRLIKKGEELTYSYGRSYWSGDRICSCGSTMCYSKEKKKGTN